MVTPEQQNAIDTALAGWRQGDVALGDQFLFAHMADLTCPLSATAEATGRADGAEESAEPDLRVVFAAVPGLVVLTQTCDIIRSCVERPYVEMAPLVRLEPRLVEEVRRMRRPAYAYVPGVATQNIVADLERTMTVEKSVLAGWSPTVGCSTEDERRDFSAALARKRARFAFPDDFVTASQALQKRLQDRHAKNHAEGAHMRALREIRVRAAPSWEAEEVKLTFWFVRDAEPEGHYPDWGNWIDEWTALFDQRGRYSIEFAGPCRLMDITAQDYIESDHLDLDRLSTASSA